MKKTLTLLLLLVFSSLSKITAQDYLPDGITFRTQEQIYNFPKNFLGSIQVLKDVHIKESIAENITNLNSLHQIIKINENFSVSNTTSSTSLNRLENLTVVGEIIQKKTKPPYRIWVVPMDNTSKLKGYLTGVEDSLIIVSNQLDQLEITQSINFQNIERIEFRKKRRVGNGFLFGALTGVTVGAIIGLASGDDDCSGGIFGSLFCYTAEQKAVINGVGLLIPGALIGGAIGSIRIKIPINGNYKTFEEQRGSLLKFRIFN